VSGLDAHQAAVNPVIRYYDDPTCERATDVRGCLEGDWVAPHHQGVVDLDFVGPRVGLARSEGRGVAQLGSAPGSGPGGRWFKSNRPD
jgi:hypothetical protein